MKCLMKPCMILMSMLIMSNAVSAQSAADLSSMQNIFEPPPPIDYKEMSSLKSEKEVKLVFGTMFLFYKKFVSSQDGSACNFTPSCSVYGLQCVQQHGPLRGMMQGFDRLTRCNSLNRHQYPMDRNTGLLIDPVD